MESIPERIDYLVAACETLIIASDDQLMGDIFDVLEVRLDLVEPYRFEGTASVPIPQDLDGQFQEETPQRLVPLRRVLWGVAVFVGVG